MSFSNPQPLALAARVLETETLENFRKPPYTARGWKILDRWAVNSPFELKKMEQYDLLTLLNRVLEQQTLETNVLMEALPTSEGLAEREILAMAEVNTAL